MHLLALDTNSQLGLHCIEGNVPLKTEEAFQTTGKAEMKHKTNLIVNLSLQHVKLNHLKKETHVLHEHTGKPAQKTIVGGELIVAPHSMAHWNERFAMCKPLIDIHTDVNLIFIIDAPTLLESDDVDQMLSAELCNLNKAFI